MKLAGRTALITGSSRGLGATIAKQFVLEGADVIITARSGEELNQVADALRRDCRDGQSVWPLTCDVSETAEVDRFFEQVGSRISKLDALVNNASIFGPMGNLEVVSWAEWVETMKVNVIGTAYMCRMAIPLLKKSERGKVVNISGGGAAKPMPSLCAYATSKAAVMRFTEELAEELRAFNIDVNSVAPGPLNTRFVDEAIAAGPERLGLPLYEVIMNIRESGGTPFELGANLCVYLSSRLSDGVTGKSISARFDDWENLHERVSELDSSEIYTMRRIDPSTIKRVGNLL